MVLSVILMIAAICGHCHGGDDDWVSYKSFHVIRAKANNLRQFSHLHKLYGDHSTIRLLSHFGHFDEDVLLAVPRQQMTTVLQDLSRNLIKFHVDSGDLDEVIKDRFHWELEQFSNHPDFKLSREIPIPNDIFNFKQYFRSSNIHHFFEQLALKNSRFVEIFTIGNSTNNRPLKVAKIGWPSPTGKPKPSIWIDCGIHAREWISPATCAYIYQQLLDSANNTNTSSNATMFLNVLDYYILPIINPDGYDYSFTNDRLWRKNRSPKVSPTDCAGTDLNRNFPFQWSNLPAMGVSNNPCGETYSGKGPASEPETRSLVNYLLTNKDLFKLYMSFHSYSQKLLFPWGHTRTPIREANQYQRLGNIFTTAMAKSRGTRYSVGSSFDIMYITSGTSQDFAKGSCNITYVYTCELPDQGANGFLLPPDQIIPVGIETYQGLQAMIHSIVKEMFA